MKTPTLDQQFLSNLSPDQKAQVWNYYLLITNSDMNSDQQVAQISEIWSRAAEDDQLIEWLEFIDYFYIDVEENDLPTAARRAYLSEYLTEMVGLLPEGKSSYSPSFLKCPDGKGYTAVPQNSREPHGSNSFNQQRCNNCGHLYAQHTPVNQQTSLPEV
jgi:hypothetical protein